LSNIRVFHIFVVIDISRKRSKTNINKKVRPLDALIIDGYVDEPSLLGVPPYISPEPRLIAGVLEEHGLDWKYVTIDQYRNDIFPRAKIVILHGGVTVPGRYLAGTPVSLREALEISHHPSISFLGGPLAKNKIFSSRNNDHGFDFISRSDLSVILDLYLKGTAEIGTLSSEDLETWLIKGASVVKEHPLFPKSLIIEILSYRGCVRYFTGGCSFCSEPEYGKPVFRKPEDILREISALYGLGIRNFRVGGQSCIISYMAENLGECETPNPNPDAILWLFRNIREQCPDIEVLHVDNANPAVIARYPEESRRILDCLSEYCTPGNVLALGMESADPKVIEMNNLNAKPHDVMFAVELINKAGSERGSNGLPKLLPGINILCGLKGESEGTYDMNYEFLSCILNKGLLLRRINIRQVLSHRDKFHLKYPSVFKRFKSKVRENIDQPMLERLLPTGSILRDVFMEKKEGNRTFGRQIGSYPLLCGAEYPLELNRSYDIIITSHGYRSVTGIRYPIHIEDTNYKELMAIPGIGKKRAATIFRKRPGSIKELIEIIGNEESARSISKYLIMK